MDTSTITRTALAGGVAGLGLAVGGITVALAADDPGAASSSSSPCTAGERPDRGGPGLHGPLAGGETAARLADELGVSEAKVTSALETVRGDLAPDPADRTEGERPEPPTGVEREAQQGALAAALAKELGVEASAVEDAFAGLRAHHEASERTDLADRLDAAVTAGDLTTADQAPVLKAFDADVLGGGLGHGGPGR